MDEVLLSIEGVSKIYPFSTRKIKKLNAKMNIKNNTQGAPAVSNVNLDLYKGEILGLLGPNGAGKSTILKMICGLIKATEGKITLEGKPITIFQYKYRKDMGALIEMPAFHEKMSGMANLKYLASLNGDITQERINDMVKLFDMTTYVHNSVATYSMGMRQKLGIVQAIMNKPKLLILDEPTNGLDPKWIVEVREILKKLATEYNMTILISSHILSEMQELCDRVAIIDNGVILAVGSVSEMNRILDGEKDTVEIMVNDVLSAGKIIYSKGYDMSVKGNILLIKMNKEELPEVTKELVVAGILIGGINVVQRKLEDIFRVVTSTKEGDQSQRSALMTRLGSQGGGNKNE